MADPNTHPCRVEFYGGETAFEIRLHNVRALSKAIGERVLAAFYKCFMGTERILTFEHLMYLNEQASQKPDGATDEHAYDRNRMVLAMILAGTMYEMGDALQELCNTGVAASLRDQPSWVRLNEIRASWNKEEYASTIRNNFAFHLGERSAYLSGIASLNDDPALLFETKNALRFAGRFVEPWCALFRAHSIEIDELSTFTEQTKRDHNELPTLVINFFREVLIKANVAIELVRK